MWSSSRPGVGDQNVDAHGQLLESCGRWERREHGCDGQVEMASIGTKTVGDLAGEFARRA